MTLLASINIGGPPSDIMCMAVQVYSVHYPIHSLLSTVKLVKYEPLIFKNCLKHSLTELTYLVFINKDKTFITFRRASLCKGLRHCNTNLFYF